MSGGKPEDHVRKSQCQEKTNLDTTKNNFWSIKIAKTV
jgi:hypothetical protein